MMKHTCIDSLNLDIIGIAETHLKGNATIELDNYQWYGNNRNNIHVRAVKGSGGVGVFVRKSILIEFHVEKLRAETEGILWIELQHKRTKERLHFWVCYLPPNNSSRAINAEEFLQTLMGDIYEFQNESLITILGDFNARVGDEEDFITGVDTLPQRDVVDYSKNQHGSLFIDFLISTNMCILNGRNCKHNDFTSVTSKGSAVVDYVLVPYECLNRFKQFEVLLATELIQQNFDVSTLENVVIPDHSFLVWEISVKALLQNEQTSDVSSTYTKYDKQNIPSEFMNNEDTYAKLNELIITLEQNQENQSYVDGIYQSFKDVLECEMNKYLNPRIIKVDGLNNKKKKN